MKICSCNLITNFVQVNSADINAEVDKENNIITWDDASIINTNSSNYIMLISIDTEALDSNFSDISLSIYVNNILAWQGTPGQDNSLLDKIYIAPNQVVSIKYSLGSDAQSLYDLIEDNKAAISVTFNGVVAKNTISGKTINEINQAVNNANVNLYDTGDNLIGSTTTAEDGTFSLESLYGITVKLKVTHSDYSLYESSFLVNEDKDFDSLVIEKEHKYLSVQAGEQTFRFLPVFSDEALTTNDVLFFDDNGDKILPSSGNKYRMWDLWSSKTNASSTSFLAVYSYKIFNPSTNLECYAYLSERWTDVFIGSTSTYPYTAQFTEEFQNNYLVNGITTPYFGRSMDTNWCPSSKSSTAPTLNGVNIADAFSAYPEPVRKISATTAWSPVLAASQQPYYCYLNNNAWDHANDHPSSYYSLIVLAKTFN